MKIGHNKYNHMKSVAEYMYRRAESLDCGILPEEAYTVGLLHDVGYIIEKEGHARAGARLLEDMGLCEDYTHAIAFHGTNGYEVQEIHGNGIQYRGMTPMLYLLQEADMSVDKYGNTVGFDGRLKDIGTRYGFDSPAFRNASETVRFLRENSFEKLFGKEKEEPVRKEYDPDGLYILSEDRDGYGTDGYDCR